MNWEEERIATLASFLQTSTTQQPPPPTKKNPRSEQFSFTTMFRLNHISFENVEAHNM